MKNEKKSGNFKVLKEIIVVCLLILFFVILVVVGRFIRGKFNNQVNIENHQTNIESDSETMNSLQDVNETSGEEIEGVDTLENYDFTTETLRISDFDVSKSDNRIKITGSVENLTDERIENLNLNTIIYNENNDIVQEISTTIPAIKPKSKSSYSFSRFDDNDEAKKIKVEILEEGIIKDEGTANTYITNND